MTDLKCAICGELVDLEAGAPGMEEAAMALQEYWEQNPNQMRLLVCEECDPKDLPMQPFPTDPKMGGLN